MKKLYVYPCSDGSMLFEVCNVINGLSARVSSQDVRFLESIGYKCVISRFGD